MTRSMIAFSVFVIIVLVFGAYKSTRQVKTEQVKIQSLQGEIAALQNEIRLLQLEVGHLSSDATIEALAREKLGMRLPDPRQIISLPDSSLPDVIFPETESEAGVN